MIEKEEFESEIVLEYKGVTVIGIYSWGDEDPSDYWFMIQGDNNEFDIRKIETYDKNLESIENLKLAIDKGLFSKKFADLFREGKIELEKVHDFIEDWHKSENDSVPIYDYLGLTQEQYRAFVENEDSLKNLLK